MRHRACGDMYGAVRLHGTGDHGQRLYLYGLCWASKVGRSNARVPHGVLPLHVSYRPGCLFNRHRVTFLCVYMDLFDARLEVTEQGRELQSHCFCKLALTYGGNMPYVAKGRGP